MKKEEKKPKAEEKPAAAVATERPVKNKEMDNRTLFIKNLPEKTTEEEIKSLSADIEACRIKESKKPNGKNKAKGKHFWLDIYI